ncbi:MAG TPA: KipI antagonist, partial [Gemmatales bacterium]|nr:KipI antagonist [Gemmatales bacterium]
MKSESNRMGLRLTSNIELNSDVAELVSAPVTPGTLQLPAGGQPLLLGVEAQTIGGYPRLGHVITPDLDQIGQLRPGATLRFQL